MGWLVVFLLCAGMVCGLFRIRILTFCGKKFNLELIISTNEFSRQKILNNFS